jgi:dTDP-4-dehydrorhamnose 3,5-epimerase
MGADGEITLLDRRIAPGVVPIQWNFVRTHANTLRGVHVHPRHADYLCVLEGEMLLGLHDMRPASPTYRASCFVTLKGAEPSAIEIAPGVAHGFYFADAAEFTYAVDSYWDPADELGCRWNDPALGLAWPTRQPLLSPRDVAAGGYAALTAELAKAAAQQTGT